MKFNKIIIIDWFDKIISAFAECGDTGEYYYLTLIYVNPENDEKIYLCVQLKYLKSPDEIKSIIDTQTIKDNWDKMAYLIQISPINRTYLVKTKDIKYGIIDFVEYERNFAWPNNVLWGEYPNTLKLASDIDNWNLYFL